MYDYFKIWIEDDDQIKKISNSPLLSFHGTYKTDTGEVLDFPLIAKWKNFELKLMSWTRLQMTGSLHKYWNGGTNENDFTLSNIKTAMNQLCDELNLNPSLATIHNLEYGVNINPSINASELIEEIICFKNERPLRPYEGNDEQFYFIEFKKGNYYLKVYDKGRQYKTNNTLRIEAKAMRSRELKEAGAITLNDLERKEVFQVLGRKLMQITKNLVFNDSSIDIKKLSPKERDLYKELVNPNKWKIKGLKSSSQYRKEQRFINLVTQYGNRSLYTSIYNLVQDKIKQLQETNCKELLSKYTGKPLQRRYCLSCNREITQQSIRSRFCSAKYVGEVAAHQCRNRDSNPRNSFKRKVATINGRGVLFDVVPFLIQKKIR